MDLAEEKGASLWLVTLPIEEFGFTIHKVAFHDALTFEITGNLYILQHVKVVPSYL